MKKTVAMLCTVLFAALGVLADTWTDPETGIEWRYTVSDGVASVGGGRYDLPAVSQSTTGAIKIPSTLGGYPVTSIGWIAFYSCSGLTSVTIPSSVTSIDGYAFAWCSGLTGVTIPDSVTEIDDGAFYGCSGLTSVTIPGSVTGIGCEAFYGCSGLTSVTIPGSVTEIGGSTFHGCSGLTSVTIPSSVTSIGYGVFLGCRGLTSVTIPSSVTSIDGYAFYDCSGLTSVSIPSSVTSIGRYAFHGCSGLTSVTIPSSVTSIGASVFSGCSGLTSVTIPEGVICIGDYAFSGCSALTSVTIPESVTSIGLCAFSGCSGLTSVEIPSSVTSIGGSAFSDCRGLMSVVIPSSVTSIGSYMFYGCSGLISVTIPEGVTSILNSAFSGCSGLKSVSIPSSVTSIDSTAFLDCSGLMELTVPAGVTSIGNRAFAGCSNLVYVSISSSLTSIGTDAFYGCSGVMSYNVDKGNPRYRSENGLLLTKDGSVLLMGVNGNVSIPSCVTTISDSAFMNCRWLESVEIPSGVTNVGQYAFSGCTGLKELIIPSGVTEIEAYTFSGCTGLERVIIAEGVTKIGQYSFLNCNSIVDVTLPNSMTSVGYGAFCSCRGLRRVVIPSSVVSIDSYAFPDCYGITEVTVPGWKCGMDLYSVTNLVISEGTTSIAESAFHDCSNLESVTIPESVTSIGDGAFYGCTGLGNGVVIVDDCVLTVNGTCPSEVVLPAGTRLIADDVFFYCYALTSITIPASVDYIGKNAFQGCESITSIIYEADSVSSLRQMIKDIRDNRWSYWYSEPSEIVVTVPFDSRAARFSALEDEFENLVISFTSAPGCIVHTNETLGDSIWGSNDVHIVNGINYITGELEIAPSSVVKFMPGGALVCRSTGKIKANDVVFARVDDAAAGRDFVITLNASKRTNWPFIVGEVEANDHTEFRNVHLDVISGTISVDDVWKSGSVHVVGGELLISAGCELIIEPGAIVKCLPGTEITIGQGARLDARGAVFTHIADDEMGGDTNGDGDETIPEAGGYVVSGDVIEDADTVYRYPMPIAVSGLISQDTVWSGYKVYSVAEELTVADGAVLTIQPGAIIKIGSGVSIIVESGAELDAKGSRAAPIVFTSVKDDEWGGDTNGDGDDTYAQAGDWNSIFIYGTANFKYCHGYYGAPNNETGIFATSGRLTMEHCTVAHSRYDGVWNWGGIIAVRNCTFFDCGNAVCPYQGETTCDNCVMAECNYGYMDWMYWVGGTFRNCVFYGCRLGWSDTNSAGMQFYDHSTVSHCCFYNPAGYSLCTCEKDGIDGCFYANPLFIDPENGDYRISANSPCVDAGDGVVAPETDYYGRPRMDVKNVIDTGVANDDGICPDVGIYEVDGYTAGTVPDLSVITVTSPASVRPGERITVAYVVTNRADSAFGTVRDGFSFVADDAVLGGQRVLAGEIEQTYAIPSNGCVTLQAKLTVPTLKAGVWRLSVTANAERDIYESVTVNNTCKSEPITIELPDVSSELQQIEVRKGENVFEISAMPVNGGTLKLKLPAGATVYGANGYVPSSERSDAVVINLGGGYVALVFPEKSEGVRSYLVIDADASDVISTEIEDAGLSLYEVSPMRLANHGVVHLVLTGVGLEGAEVALVGSTTVRSSKLEKTDLSQVTATFVLNQAAVGNYDVRVTMGGEVRTLANAVELYKTATGPKLEAQLVLPSSVRDGRIYTAWVAYENVGDEDMPAPVFTIKRGGDSQVCFAQEGSSTYTSDPLYLVGLGNSTPRGYLKSGESGKAPFRFFTDGMVDIRLLTVMDNANEDLNGFSTLEEYRTGIANAATRLWLRGVGEPTFTEILAQSLNEARGEGGAAVCGTLLHATTRMPLAGYALRLVDTNDQSVAMATISGENGEYALSTTVAGDYTILVDGVQAQEEMVYGLDKTDVLGETLAVLPYSAVQGSVFAQGVPVADAKIVLDDRITEGSEDVVALTDEYGSYRFDGLADGEYRITALPKSGFCSETTGWFVVTNGITIDQNIEYSTVGASVLCRLMEGESDFTKGTLVLTEMTTSERLSTVAGEDGGYLFDGVPVGEYHLEIVADGKKIDSPSSIVIEDSVQQEFWVEVSDADVFSVMLPVGMVTHVTTLAPIESVEVRGWDFDSDGNIDSTEKSPKARYALPGEYDVTLYYSDSNGVARTCVERKAVRVFEKFDNILNPNGHLVDGKALRAVSVSDNGVVLSGDSASTLAVGDVVGHEGGGEQGFVRRLTSSPRSLGDGSYTFDTEVAELGDLYEQYFVSGEFTFTAEQVNAALRKQLSISSVPSSAKKDWDFPVNWEREITKSLSVSVSGSVTKYTDVIDGSYGFVRTGGIEYSWINQNEYYELKVGCDLSLQGDVKKKEMRSKIAKPRYNLEGPGIVLPYAFYLSANIQLGFDLGLSGSGKVAIEKSQDIRRRTFVWCQDGKTTSTVLDWKPENGPLKLKFSGSVSGEADAFTIVGVYISWPAYLKRLGHAGGGVKAGIKVGLEQELSWDTADGFDSAFSLTTALYASLCYDAGFGSAGSAFSAAGDIPWKVSIPGSLKVGKLGFAQSGSGLTVNFSAKNPQLEGDGLLQAFHGKSLGVSEHAWNFGDGQTGVGASASHTYDAAGEYTVKLSARCNWPSTLIPLGEDTLFYKHSTAKVRVFKDKPPEPQGAPPPPGSGGTGGGGEDGTGGQINPSKSIDPNEMVGPDGIGENRLVKPGEWMDYTIYFENKKEADVAAQEVFVDAQLDANLDWSTFETGEIAFNNQNEIGLAGYQNGTKTVAQEGADYKVQMSVTFDEKTGAVRWYLRSYDPNHADYGYWPASTEAGFLPPNDDTHRGEGHITYRVRVRDDASADSCIDAAASIVFDQNEAIVTDPAWWNAVGEFITLDLSLADVGTTNLTLVAGEAFGELPTPSREGYTFAGWYLNNAFAGDAITAETIVPGGMMNIYAKWIAIPTPTPTPTPTPEPEPETIVEVLEEAAICDQAVIAKVETIKGCVLDEEGIVGSVEIKIAKESKSGSKVTGSVTTLEGKKLSAKTTDSKATVKLSEGPAVVEMSVKGMGTMSIKIGATEDGELAFTGTLEDYIVTSAAIGGEITKDAAFYLDGEVPAEIDGYEVNEDYLPCDVPVTMSGKKWTLEKAVTVKYAKDKKTSECAWIVNGGKEYQDDANVSGLKLTYTAKTGVFKGSFSVYTLKGAKMKKMTAKVTGVVVDGVGYGIATIKGADSIPIVIE